jgi:hypothetical protein
MLLVLGNALRGRSLIITTSLLQFDMLTMIRAPGLACVHHLSNVVSKMCRYITKREVRHHDG